jgi:hypothetical protein
MHTHPYLSKRFSIWRDAEQLMVQTKQAVRQFSRYHKYNLGQDLRKLTRQVLNFVTHAINQKAHRCQWVERLVLIIDELKLTIQVAKTLGVFASFNVFEQLARLAVLVSKQAMAWQKKLQGGTAIRGRSL